MSSVLLKRRHQFKLIDQLGHSQRLRLFWPRSLIQNGHELEPLIVVVDHKIIHEGEAGGPLSGCREPTADQIPLVGFKSPVRIG